MEPREFVENENFRAGTMMNVYGTMDNFDGTRTMQMEPHTMHQNYMQLRKLEQFWRSREYHRNYL